MPLFILIPLQIIVGYAVAKVVGAVGDVAISGTTKTIRGIGAAFENTVSNMEIKAADAKIEAAEAKARAAAIDAATASYAGSQYDVSEAA